MNVVEKPKIRARWQMMRRLSLLLMSLGITNEFITISGMILGILAGFAFMITGESPYPQLFWGLAMMFCLMRIFFIRLDDAYQLGSTMHSLEEVFFSELPERVSDAMTLIGFGFAVDSNPWLGLASALAAVFSAYISSIAYSRGARRKTAFSGPMTRVNRLILLSLTSLFVIIEFPPIQLSRPVPEIALWVILIGCIATVISRWITLRGIKL